MGVGQSALPLVHVGDDNPERTLPQTWQYGLRLPVAEPLVPQFRVLNWQSTRLQTYLHLSPESLPDFIIGGVTFVALNRWVPAGNRKPFFAGKEERALQRSEE